MGKSITFVNLKPNTRYLATIVVDEDGIVRTAKIEHAPLLPRWRKALSIGKSLLTRTYSRWQLWFP